MALIALGMVGITFVVATADSAHAAGVCAVTPGSGAYPTISAATADVNCSTVTVPAGTFAEQVTITHALVLTGAGAGQTIITFPSSPAMTNNAFLIVQVQSAGTTISNLTINGHNYQCTTNCNGYNSNYYGYLGVDLEQGGVTVDAVSVLGVITAVGSLANSSNGQRVTVKNSYFGAPVGAGPFGSPFYFENNTVVGNGSSEQTGLGGGTYVSGNTFKHFHAPPCSGCVPGAYQGAAIATGAGTITNNTILDSDNGIVVTQAQQTVTITGNTFSGIGTAITLGLNLSSQVVQNNHITNVVSGGGWPNYPGVGIAICGERQDIIKGNTISGAANYGIALFAYQTPQCSNPGPGNYPTANNAVSGNTISGSGKADLYDSTRGSNTDGTANGYSGNTCAVSQPAGLCGSSSGGTSGGSTGSGAGTPTTTTTAGGTPTPASTGTAASSVGVGGAQTGSGGNGAGTSSSVPVLALAAAMGLLLVGGGGILAFVLLRQRRLAARNAADSSVPPFDQYDQYDQYGQYRQPYDQYDPPNDGDGW